MTVSRTTRTLQQQFRNIQKRSCWSAVGNFGDETLFASREQSHLCNNIGLSYRHHHLWGCHRCSFSTTATTGRGRTTTTNSKNNNDLCEISIQDSLATAANEARKVTDLHRHKLTKDKYDGNKMTTSSALQLTEATDAADKLLDATHMKHNLSVAMSKDKKLQTSSDVTALHKAFLTAIQWCLALAPSANDKELLDNPLLERALALAIRAHDLDFQLHLPLYSNLATAAAEHSMDPVPWILKMSEWVNVKAGPVENTFFSRPLLILMKRHRLDEVSHLIKAMDSLYGLQYVDATTTKEILMMLKDNIRSAWTTATGYSSQEHDAIDIVMKLERSVWKIFDYDPQDDSSLREAIETIIDTEEDTRDVIITLEELLSMDNRGIDADDDIDDEAAATAAIDFQEMQYFLNNVIPSGAKAEMLRDLMKAATAGNQIESVEQQNAQFTRRDDERNARLVDSRTKEEKNDDDSDDSSDEFENDDYYHVSTHSRPPIYTRNDYYHIPDVASQLYENNGGRELLYTEDFEQYIMEELAPTNKSYHDDDDNDDDEH